MFEMFETSTNLCTLNLSIETQVIYHHEVVALADGVRSRCFSRRRRKGGESLDDYRQENQLRAKPSALAGKHPLT